MAAWQVEFYIVPSRALAAAPQPLTPAVLADTDWWAKWPLAPDYRTRLESVAAYRALSDAEHEVWGPEEGNRVDVWSRGGRVQRVTVRVDVRKLDSRFGAALLGFVRAVGGLLVRGDGLLVGPTISGFVNSLRGSLAWRHANDPTTFVSKYADTDEDIE